MAVFNRLYRGAEKIFAGRRRRYLTAFTAELKKMKVMLDAGHYGRRNQSPVLPESYDSIAMWRLCELLAEELESYGIEVGKTRTEQGRDLAVTTRGRMAYGYDLFISLHSNASVKESVDRVDIYAPFDVSLEQKELPSLLINAISELMDVSKGSVKKRVNDSGNEYYGVMRGARYVGCPMYMIVEHSFHTNKKAALWLSSDENLKRLARIEAAVIASFYRIKRDFLKGDVDMDGDFDSVDVMLIKRAYFGTLALDEAQKKLADMNSDGKIDVFDYLLAKRSFFE